MSARPAKAHERWRERARSTAWLLLALACVAAPFPLGGHPPMAALFLAILSSLSLWAALAATSTMPRLPASATALLSISLASIVFTLLQRVPVPCDWIASIAGEAVEHRRAVARLLGAPPPSSCTLTHSVGATDLALVRGLSAQAAFFAALLLLGRPHARRRALTLVALTGGALAVIGLAHRALGIRSLFGLYEPVHAHPSVVTPLLNGNNLAGLLLLSAPITFALAARAEARGRYAFLAVGAAEVVVLFATGSRGGIAAFFAVALLGLLALTRRRKRNGDREKTSRTRRLELGLALSVAVALGGILAYDGLVRELETEQVDSKRVLLEQGASLALRAPLLGLGRGAFGQALTPTFPYDRRVEFAENALIQRAAEWGLPFAFFVLATLVVAFARGALRRRSLVGMAAALGLSGLALQNLVDFSLELPGVAIPAAIALAVVVSPGRVGAPSRPLAPALAGALALALVVSAFAFAPFVPERTADTQLARLEGLARSTTEPPLGPIAEALALHPRDPAIALVSAHLVRRTRPERAGPWLNRSLELSPHWSATHLELARWLLVRGRVGQAAIHLSRAAALDVLAVRGLTCALIAGGFAEDAVRAAPEGPNRLPYLERATSCVTRRDPRSPMLERLVLEVEPDALEARVRQAERDCAERDEHLDVLRVLTKTHKTSPRPHLALARCLVARKEHREAKAVARAALALMPQLHESFSKILRSGAAMPPPGGSLDPEGRVGEGVFPPPATHAR